MKKLLALVLVLGLASVAGAALKLDAPASVDGLATTISVVAGGGVVPTDYFAVVVADGAGVVTGFTVVAPDSIQFDMYEGADAFLPGSNGIWGGIANIAGTTTAADGTPFLTGINLTVPAFGLVTVQLIGDLFGQQTVVDTAEVMFTPEPITMTLLGLGGLVALRRRSA